MKQIIPTQYTGRAIDAQKSRDFLNASAAETFFQIAQERLSNVNKWHVLTGKAFAEFALVNSQGNIVHRAPKIGDHFKIDVPGPGSKEGDGYDWVRVENVHSMTGLDADHYGFTVRPCNNPNSSKTEIAHFYSSESTSTFLVRRNGNVVSIEISDRNIKPNEHADKATDAIRNTLIGAIGSIGLSEIQWQHLAEAILSLSGMAS